MWSSSRICSVRTKSGVKEGFKTFFFCHHENSVSWNVPSFELLWWIWACFSLINYLASPDRGFSPYSTDPFLPSYAGNVIFWMACSGVWLKEGDEKMSQPIWRWTIFTFLPQSIKHANERKIESQCVECKTKKKSFHAKRIEFEDLNLPRFFNFAVASANLTRSAGSYNPDLITFLFIWKDCKSGNQVKG